MIFTSKSCRERGTMGNPARSTKTLAGIFFAMRRIGSKRANVRVAERIAVALQRERHDRSVTLGKTVLAVRTTSRTPASEELPQKKPPKKEPKPKPPSAAALAKSYRYTGPLYPGGVVTQHAESSASIGVDGVVRFPSSRKPGWGLAGLGSRNVAKKKEPPPESSPGKPRFPAHWSGVDRCPLCRKNTYWPCRCFA